MVAAVNFSDSNNQVGSRGQKQRLLTAARQFEAILVKTMLSEAKLFGAGGDELASWQQEMVTQICAEQIVNAKGLGIAAQIYQAAARNQPRSRSDNWPSNGIRPKSDNAP